jgi:hypothetical protein
MNPVVHFEMMPAEDRKRMTNNNHRVVSRNEWTPEGRSDER